MSAGSTVSSGNQARSRSSAPDREQPAPAAADDSATDGADAGSPLLLTDELIADRDEMVAGTNVRLEDAVIRAKTGNLMRVRVGKRDIFVAPIDPSSLDFLTVGASVDAQGTLRETPSARQAQLLFAMGSREARRLARDRVYVDAWFVSAMD